VARQIDQLAGRRAGGLGKAVLIQVDAVESECAHHCGELGDDQPRPGRFGRDIHDIEQLGQADAPSLRVEQRQFRMLVGELRLGAVDRPVGQRRATARLHRRDRRSHRAERQAPSKCISEIVGRGQQRVVAPHPVVELHDVQVIAAECVAARRHVSLSGCEIRQKAVARRLRPALQHVQSTAPLRQHTPIGSGQRRVQPITAQRSGWWYEGERRHRRRPRPDIHHLLQPFDCLVKMRQDERQSARLGRTASIRQRHSDAGSLAGAIHGAIGRDVVDREHEAPRAFIFDRPSFAASIGRA